MNTHVKYSFVVIPIIGFLLYVAYPKVPCACLPAYDFLKMQYGFDKDPLDTEINVLNKKFLLTHPIGTDKQELYDYKAGGYIYSNCKKEAARNLMSCEFIAGYPVWSDKGFIKPAGITLKLTFDKNDKLTGVNFGKL